MGTRASKPRVAVLYHYMHPDDVVSARHFDGLCTGLVDRGWEVEALPCNRGCRDESRVYSLDEQWRGIQFHRVWRPRLRQASGFGRVSNAAWMTAAWSRLATRRHPPDAVIVGTDPVLSVSVAPILARRMRVAHWAYDLYPEAPIADGLMAADGPIARVSRRVAQAGYRACDMIADLGPCMQQRIQSYGHRARTVTLVPWALTEPPHPAKADPEMRRTLFGEAKLGVLYSGNFGRAHSFEGFLALARRLREDSVHFCFAVRGNRSDELRRAVRNDDHNISFAGFCSEEQLAHRLSAADIHLASLRNNWSGLVVPSKFFGSLAVGRPVVFAGPTDSGISRWIKQHDVGWLLADDTADTGNTSNAADTPNAADTTEAVALALKQLAANPSELVLLQEHCHRVYHQEFCYARTIDRWDHGLRSLLE